MTVTPVIVDATGVSKRFTIHRHKSIKERLVDSSSERRHREDFWALRDIDLKIDAGSTLGLVGHNGSGKSTLLKIIGGILEPTSGSVLRRGRMAALLELGAGFHPDLTGRENVYLNAAILGLTQKEIDRHFAAIVDFSGIEPFIDSQVKFFSSGMYVRLAFAVAVHVDPDLLLVDEVLAVGDEPFQNKCMAKIEEFQAEGRTIIFVSHSAEQVSNVCDRVMVLDHGVARFDGATAEGLAILDEIYAEGSPLETSSGVRLESLQIVPRSRGRAANRYDITLTLDAPAGLQGAYPEVVLETPNGFELRRMSGRALSAAETAEGPLAFDVELDGSPLTPGDYIVRGRLVGADDRVIGSRVLRADLTIGGSGDDLGPVKLLKGASLRSRD